jgi:hypothetical protein
LSKLPCKFLSQHVIPTGLVSATHMEQVNKHVQEARKRDPDSGRLVELCNGWKLHSISDLVAPVQWQSVTALTVGGRGAGEQLAVVDAQAQRVYVFARREYFRDEFSDTYEISYKDFTCFDPCCFDFDSVAFNARGDLIICNGFSIYMFDSDGLPLKSADFMGDHWEYCDDVCMSALSVHPNGHMVVCDQRFHCVFVVSEVLEQKFIIASDCEDLLDHWEVLDPETLTEAVVFSPGFAAVLVDERVVIANSDSLIVAEVRQGTCVKTLEKELKTPEGEFVCVYVCMCVIYRVNFRQGD